MNISRTSRRCALVAAASLASIFASCSDDAATDSTADAGGEDGGSDNEGTGTGAGSNEPDGGSGDSGSEGSDDDAQPEAWVSPLAELMGWEWSEPSDDDLSKERQVEELVAACMREEGFEYTPRDPSTRSVDDSDEEGPFSLPPDEFAEQYGYGISTIDLEDLMVDEPPSVADDPNDEYLQSLSPSAQMAYDDALYGEFVEGEQQDDRGCHGDASDEVYGPPPGPDSAVTTYDALETEINALDERVRTDERVVAARDEWSNCLADAGFPGMKKLNEPRREVQTRAADLFGQTSADQMAVQEGDVLIGEGGNVIGGGDARDDVDPQALEELEDFERDIATADYECLQPYEDVRRQVQTEIEEEFIDDNRDELDRYRDAIAAGEILPKAGGVG